MSLVSSSLRQQADREYRPLTYHTQFMTKAFSSRDIGDASTMGIYAIILANIVVTVFVQVLRRGSEEGVTT